MEKRRFTREAWTGVAASVSSAGRGDTSYAGRQHIKETKKLHPLVDPAGYELIRKSLPRYVELPSGQLELANGIPMLDETLLDTTGSMGGNVELAFRALPTMYGLLTEGAHPALGRYDPQLINAIFGDVQDNYVLYRSQAEMDVKIAEQLTLMVPERDGGDATEDPDYGIFGATYLTSAFIHAYGLKSYHTTVTDAPCRERVDKKSLVRVFGESVFEKVIENGFALTARDLPSTKEMVALLGMRAHAFVIQVGRHQSVTNCWSNIYGKDRVVIVETTEFLPFVKAAIIGLTEGVLDLQTMIAYLQGVGCSKEIARSIQRSVAGIPIGAQVALPNFDKIPLRGTVFAKKQDLWPVDASNVKSDAVVSEQEAQSMWL